MWPMSLAFRRRLKASMYGFISGMPGGRGLSFVPSL